MRDNEKVDELTRRVGPEWNEEKKNINILKGAFWAQETNILHRIFDDCTVIRRNVEILTGILGEIIL